MSLYINSRDGYPFIHWLTLPLARISRRELSNILIILSISLGLDGRIWSDFISFLF